MSEGSERTPLIRNNPDLPPTYTHQIGDHLPSAPTIQALYVDPIEINDSPPPYASIQDNNTVVCKVCSQPIDLTGRWDQHVVKCASCSEATPIKTAPLGKKYVRCPCNCLLVCSNTSRKIACPRPNCKRVINLRVAPAVPTFSNSSGMCQILCAHCDQLFLFSTLSNPLARCPNCRRISSIRPDFVRHRRIFWSLLFFLLVLLLVIEVVYSAYHYRHAWIAGYVLVSFLIVLSGCHAVKYIGTKVSTIEGAV